MNAALLLAFVAAVQFGPEAMPGSPAAWGYVAHGIEAAVLWAVVLALLSGFWPRVIAAWACVESIERSVCRMALPMDRIPKLEPGQTLCDAAFGPAASFVSIAVALGIACALTDRLWK